MQQRKIKLGKGELEHVRKDGLSLSIKDARDYFLDAVREVAPEVLEDLANEPFKLYKAAGLAFKHERYEKETENLEFYDKIRAQARAEHLHRWNHPEWLEHFEDKEIDYDDNILAMQKSIFDWSKKYNLNAAWCRARAYETLDNWHRFSSMSEIRMWNYDMSLEPMIAHRKGELDFVFRIRSAYPTFGFRAEEKEKITKAFEKELNEFLDARERIAKENGMTTPKQKREYLHFVWFAYWLVKEWTHSDIYKEFNVSRETVKTALESVRNLLKTPNDEKSILTRPLVRVGAPRKK